MQHRVQHSAASLGFHGDGFLQYCPAADVLVLAQQAAAVSRPQCLRPWQCQLAPRAADLILRGTLCSVSSVQDVKEEEWSGFSGESKSAAIDSNKCFVELLPATNALAIMKSCIR